MNIKIINPATGKIGELSKKAWEQNKLSMPDWKVYGDVEEPIKIKGLKETIETPSFTDEEPTKKTPFKSKKA